MTWSQNKYLERLWMQNNQKMRFEVFIHSDDVLCFHVDVQGTQKVIVIGHHNSKDEVLKDNKQAKK
jgi:hypothetical protein